MADPRTLTPTALAGHLACAHLVQLDRRRRAGEGILLRPDPRREALERRGLLHEQVYVERLRAEGRTVLDLRDTRDVAATAQAMRDGHGAIVQAPLGDDRFFGVADVLLRVDAPSALGAWSYEPADTKLARETKAGTLLQLCTYADLLAPLQGGAPQALHVITPVRDERYRAADFAAYFRFVRARLLAAVTADPPLPTYPDPNPHCDVCGYWKHCADQRRADDHPSLVAGIRALHVRELQRQGLWTVAALAEHGGLPAAPGRGQEATYERLAQQARLQVRARGLPLPPIEPLPVVPGRGLARLPEPSPGDVFLDFEGDPFAGATGLEYLTGWCVLDGSALHHEQRWALDAVAEKAACEAFVDAIEARLARHPDLHVYHFGAYEPAALKRLCARHDTRREQLDRLLRGRRFVDLHAVVREALRIGVERYGLKELEPLHGFTRTLDLSEAGRARLALELALELGTEAALDPDVRAEVAVYNREDCASTASLRAWLEEQRQALVRAGQHVPRPEPSEDAPSEGVSERDRRIAEAQRALLAGVPADPAARTADHTARALLASMLGYFRQEEKNAWWEHFRLRELPADERLGEREMLAGLEFVGEEQKAPRQRNARFRFTFPPQETAIDTGDEVFFVAEEDPDGREAGKRIRVEELDLEVGRVVLSSVHPLDAHQPTAVLRNQVVQTGRLEDALLAFAADVAEGRQSPGFAAARDLLWRRPPSSRGASHETSQDSGHEPGHEHADGLRREGESTLAACTRLCAALDGGVLAVQGPPGTGKTFAGARAIVALAAAGKRVGVTAVSHKVIDNLLTEVGSAMREAGVTLRLAHRDDGAAPDGIEHLDTAAALAAVAPGAVVGGTAWLWARDEAAGVLDHLFVDEAGQMALAQTLAAARAARNLVLLGDPQQLDQPSRGAHPEGADTSTLTHVIGPERATLGDAQGLFLDTTFRLHPRLCAWTSRTYYDGRLVPRDGDTTRRRLQGPTPFPGAGAFLVEVEHQGNQAAAREEVEAAARVVRSLLRDGVRWIDRAGHARALLPRDILVIAPYNAQVAALRRRLAADGVTRVGTVDKFQGQEAPVVVYSCTSSSVLDAPRGMAFLFDPHRFNVATSRAEGVVIVVASPALFEPACRTPQQMVWANGFCSFREVAKRVGLTGL